MLIMTRSTVQLFMLLFLVTTSLQTRACPRPPGYGYIVHSVVEDFTRYPFGIITSQYEQTLTGDWLSNDFGALGYQSSWQGVTNINGDISRLGYATPATWRINAIDMACSPKDSQARPPYYNDIYFQPSSDQKFDICYRYPNGLSGNPGNLRGAGQQQHVTVTGDMQNYTPASWVTYNANGDQVGSGSLGQVTSNSCVCYWSSNYFVYGQVTLTTYLLDQNNEGIGTFNSQYTYQ